MKTSSFSLLLPVTLGLVLLGASCKKADAPVNPASSPSNYNNVLSDSDRQLYQNNVTYYVQVLREQLMRVKAARNTVEVSQQASFDARIAEFEKELVGIDAGIEVFKKTDLEDFLPSRETLNKLVEHAQKSFGDLIADFKIKLDKK